MLPLHPADDRVHEAAPVARALEDAVPTVCGIAFSSSSESFSGVPTSPSTLSALLFGSGIWGIQWFRTKKRSLGVRYVVSASSGVSAYVAYPFSWSIQRLPGEISSTPCTATARKAARPAALPKNAHRLRPGRRAT